MDDALIAAAVEILAISSKPKESIALKTVTAYGQVANVVMAVPLAITLGGPLTISQAPAPQPNFPSQAFQEMKRGPGQQIGRPAVAMVVSTGNMTPFVPMMDGNELLRHRQDIRQYFDQGEGSTPFTLA